MQDAVESGLVDVNGRALVVVLWIRGGSFNDPTFGGTPLRRMISFREHLSLQCKCLFSLGLQWLLEGFPLLLENRFAALRRESSKL